MARRLWVEEIVETDAKPETCWICSRPFGERVERHHVVPRSKGGKDTVPVHRICHKTLHATFTNAQLARMHKDGQLPSGHAEMADFLKWIAAKDPDFTAKTKQRKG